MSFKFKILIQNSISNELEVGLGIPWRTINSSPKLKPPSSPGLRSRRSLRVFVSFHRKLDSSLNSQGKRTATIWRRSTLRFIKWNSDRPSFVLLCFALLCLWLFPSIHVVVSAIWDALQVIWSVFLNPMWLNLLYQFWSQNKPIALVWRHLFSSFWLRLFHFVDFPLFPQFLWNSLCVVILILEFRRRQLTFFSFSFWKFVCCILLNFSFGSDTWLLVSASDLPPCSLRSRIFSHLIL